MSEDFIYTTSQNNQISVTTYGDQNLKDRPAIIISHGFKGFKDWGFFPFTANYFAEKGFFVITFNFSHNGIGIIKNEFTELEKFSKNTFSLEIEELSDIISAYQKDFFGKTSNSKIGLLGHSRGGAISLLTAYKIKSISSVATWASVSTLDWYSERQKEAWRKKRYFSVLNTRTNQEMKLNVSLLEDLENNINSILNIRNAVTELKKPLLINHGSEDLAVRAEEAKELYSFSDKSITELNLIENTGHTFGCVHPFEGSNDKFDSLLEKSASFFKSTLLIK